MNTQIKNTYKRFIAMALSFVMVLGLFTVFPQLADPIEVHAAATYASWTAAGQAAKEGTDYIVSGTAYTIKTPLGLAWVAVQTNSGSNWSSGKTFLLGNDIDLGGQNSTIASGNWKPIGSNQSIYFTGIFDGQGHVVKGIYINTSEDNQGLFGKAKNCTIKNLGVTNSEITGGGDVGGIVGYSASNTEITGCFNAGQISSNGKRAGGIIGYAEASISIINCYNTGKIVNTYYTFVNEAGCGGIAGFSDGTANSKIINCFNLGDISGGVVYTGGIAGRTLVVLANTYNTGMITSSRKGGIAGYNFHSIHYSQYLEGTAEKPVGEGSFAASGSKTADYMKSTSFMTDLNDWVNKNSATYPDVHKWQGSIDGYPALEAIQITPPDSVKYTGQSQQPKPKTVKFGGEILTENTDYTLSYTMDTINTGDKDIVAKGKGAYDGWFGRASYTITPAAISGTVNSYSGRYDGKAHTVTASGFPSGTVINYGLTQGNYDMTSPKTFSDVGKNTIYWQATNPSSNYKTVTGSATVEIKPMYDTWEAAGNAAVSGTDYSLSGDTYTISTAKGLAWVANKTIIDSEPFHGKDFILANDIDLGDSTLVPANTPWNSIGPSMIFNGNFDGQNHTVSGLYGNPLFGRLATTIANVKLYSPQVSGGGQLINEVCWTGTIKNCGIEGEINIDTGKIAGIATTNTNKIIDCYNTAKIHSKNGNVAGIALNSVAAKDHSDKIPLISGCKNTGELMSESGNVAGIVSDNYGLIENSYNGAKIHSNKGNVAGIASIAGADSTRSNLKNCYNTGTISTNDGDAAGLVVQDNGLIYSCYNYGAISSAGYTAERAHPDKQSGNLSYVRIGGLVASSGGSPLYINCFNAGPVTCTGDKSVAFIGGIVGLGERGSRIGACYNTGVVSTPKGIIGGIVGYDYSQIDGCYNAGMIKLDSAEDSLNRRGAICGYNGWWYGASSYYLTGTAERGSNKVAAGTNSMTSSEMKSEDFLSTMNEWITANRTGWPIQGNVDLGEDLVSWKAVPNYYPTFTTRTNIFTVTKPQDVAYDKAAHQMPPQSVVADGKILTADTEYTLVYPSDVTNIGIKDIQIIGKGSYSGWTGGTSYAIYDKPSAPKKAKAEVSEKGDAITLTWEAADDNYSEITDYIIYEVVDGNEQKLVELGASAAKYTQSGLSRGSSHTYKIYAKNAAGQGPAAELKDVQIPDVPGSVVELKAEVLSGTEAALSWNKPDENYSKLTGYTVKVYQGETVIPAVSEGEGVKVAVDLEKGTAAVSGLSKGETYTFGVSAVNAVGSGAEVKSGEVTMWKNPSAPGSVKLEAGDGRIKVSWGAPESDGNSPVSKYIIYHREAQGPHPEDGGWTVKEIPAEEASVDEASGLFTHTLEEMKIAVWYEIQIGAVNGSGEERTSIYTKVCTRVPDVPEIGAVRPGENGAVIESIRVENNGGTEITEYRVYAAEVSDSAENPEETAYEQVCIIQPPRSSDSHVSSARVTGLENGRQYKLRVSAVNAVGESLGKSNEQYVQSGLPSVPGNFKAEAVTGQGVKASYSASEGNGSEVQGYRIYLNGSSEPAGETAELEYVTYLPENGDSVSIAVSAYNAIGESTKTGAVTVTAGTPSVPEITGLTLYSTDGEENGGKTGLDLSWSESSSNGIKLEGYKVYLSNLTDVGESKEFTAGKQNGALVRELNIPSEGNLEYGKSYQVEVSAANLIGESRRSTAKKFTYGVPYAPEITGVEASPGELTVNWTAAKTVNSEIKAYRVYVNGEQKTEVSWLAVEGGYKLYYNGEPFETVAENLDSFSLKLTGLANGSEYRFEVSAVNESGEGFKSEPVTGVPATSATEVREVKAEATGTDTVTVTWKDPYSTGGSSIRDYAVSGWKTDSAGVRGEQLTAAQIVQESALGRKAVVSGLELGQYYVFEVRARTSAEELGAAGSSNVVRTYYAPTAPVITKVETGSTEKAVKVYWTAPEDTGGTPVASYDIYYAGTKLNSKPISGDAVSVEVTHVGLVPGRAYLIKMNATNQSGVTSGWSNEMNIQLGAPAAPENLKAECAKDAESGTYKVHVSWTSENLKDSGVSNFFVKARIDGQEEKEWRVGASQHETDLTFEAGKKLEISVAAGNQYGKGTFAGPVKVEVGAPDAPAVTAVTAGYEELKVEWKSPEQTNASGIRLYNIYVNGQKTGERESGLEETFEYVITETGEKEKLSGGTVYEVTVTAVNQEGESRASEAVRAMPWTKPSRPTVKEGVTAGDRTFSFEFEKPANCGLEVAEYCVYVDGVRVPETVSDTEAYAVIDADRQRAEVRQVSNGLREGKDYGHLFYVSAVVRTPDGEELESEAPEETEQEKVTTGIPTVPQITEATAGDRGVSVKWSKADGLGREVDYYEVEYGAAEPITTTDLTVRVPGENGEAVKIKVRAHNEIGYSGYSDELTVTPGTPTVPEITKAESGDGKVTLEWVASTANVGTIQVYKVYLDGDWLKEVDGKQTGVEIDGLTNGQEYRIQVSAGNGIGEGLKSEAVKVVPGKEPGEVENLTGKALSDTELELSWSKPAETGGFGSLTYTVEGPGSITVDQASAKAKVTGLSKGTGYSYVVKAVNAKGSSIGVSTGTLTTMTNPENPQYSELRGAGLIEAEWYPVTDGGGSEVKGYNIYLEDLTSPVESSGKVPANAELIPHNDKQELIKYSISEERYEEEAGGAVVSRALVTGHKYLVTIKAVNGIGLESEPGTGLRVTITGEAAITKPSPAENVKVKPGDGRLEVSWSEPSYKGGGNAKITGYRIYAGKTAEELMQVADVTDLTSLSYTVSKLATGESLLNGNTYYVSVAAKNDKVTDYSEQSKAVSGTPGKEILPSAPEWLKLDNETGTGAFISSATKDSFVFSWKAAESAVSYELTIDTDNGKKVETFTTSETSYEYKGAVENIPYAVTVTAVNESGGKATGEIIHAYTNHNVLKDPEGEYPAHYAEGKLAWIDADYDGKEDKVVEYGAPGKPEEVEAKLVGKTMLVSWKAPKESGNGTIDTYYMFIDPGIKTSFAVDAEGNPSGENEYGFSRREDGKYSIKVPAVNGKFYAVQVAAENEYAMGDKSESKGIEVVEIKEATNLTASHVEGSGTEIELSWTEPETEGVYGYRLFEFGDQNTSEVLLEKTAENETGYTVSRETDPESGEPVNRVKYVYKGTKEKDYSFTVTALYNEGSDETNFSNIVSITTRTEKPGKPVITQAEVSTDGSNRIGLTWTAPENMAPDGYVLYVNGTEERGFEVNGTSGFFTGESEKTLVLRLAGIKAYGEDLVTGELSEAVTVSTVTEEVLEPDAPQAPQNVKAELSLDANGNLTKADNLKISWDAVTEAEGHQPADGYNVIVNDEIVSGESPVTETEYVYTAEAGKDYAIQIQPVAGEVKGAKSEVVTVSSPAESYPAPGQVKNTKAEYAKDQGEIRISFDPVEGAEYYKLYNNGAVYEEEGIAVTGTGTSLTVSAEAEKRYLFQVSAVKVYPSEAGEKEAEGAKSEIVTVSTKSDDEKEEIPTAAGAPKIARAISDGLGNVKLYWTEPAPQEGEIGEIDGYNIYINGKGLLEDGTLLDTDGAGRVSGQKLLLIPASEKTGYGEYGYLFTDVQKTISVNVVAVKLYKDYPTPISSADSNVWHINYQCNEVIDSSVFTKDEDGKVTEVNDDPEIWNSGIKEKTKDELGSGKLPLGKMLSVKGKVVGTDGAAKVTLIYVPTQHEMASVPTNADGSFELKYTIPETPAVLSEEGGSTTGGYAVKVTKEYCTYYEVTDIDITQVEAIDLDSIELYVGDANGDGKIDTYDKQLVNGKFGQGTAGEPDVEGDVTGDGDVNSYDVQMINGNLGKSSVSITYQELQK